MSLSTFAALLLFSFVSSVTPGPNNIMLFASGLNFGMRRTWPHAIGISIGFGVLLVAVGFGLGVVIERLPLIFTLIKVLGGLYMLLLAWRIANSGPVEAEEGESRPLTILEAAAFQWVNPKAWVMATVAMSVYTTQGNYFVNVLLVVFAFVVINFPSVTIWAAFGTYMKKFLKDPVKLKFFNFTMAGLLVLSLWPMFLM